MVLLYNNYSNFEWNNNSHFTLCISSLQSNKDNQVSVSFYYTEEFIYNNKSYPSVFD